MKLSADMKAFETRLGHSFSHPELLLRALTHSSMATETRPSNQRLEFLGDRVLNLILAEAVFEEDRDAAEGQLAPRYNALVKKETCANVASGIGLGDVMRLGRSEQMSGGRRKEAMLGDAMEAVVAAIYLDADLEAARSVILALWKDQIAAAGSATLDPKTALQEWAQARGLKPPDYVQVARTGPDHAPVFTIEARLSQGRSARAEAGSKRAAEQAAAQALLDRIAAVD